MLHFIFSQIIQLLRSKNPYSFKEDIFETYCRATGIGKVRIRERFSVLHRKMFLTSDGFLYQFVSDLASICHSCFRQYRAYQLIFAYLLQDLYREWFISTKFLGVTPNVREPNTVSFTSRSVVLHLKQRIDQSICSQNMGYSFSV
jgi:hypothetical protein